MKLFLHSPSFISSLYLTPAVRLVDDVIATAWNWHKSHPKGYEDK
ncbi:hypothetical protein FOF74_009295 [Lactobacillus gasseri]